MDNTRSVVPIRLSQATEDSHCHGSIVDCSKRIKKSTNGAWGTFANFRSHLALLTSSLWQAESRQPEAV